MSTKTISIMDDVYEGLRRNKLETESFSDEIRRLLNEKRPKLTEFLGLWKHKSPQEFKRIEDAIKSRREYTAKAREERLKEFTR